MATQSLAQSGKNREEGTRLIYAYSGPVDGLTDYFRGEMLGTVRYLVAALSTSCAECGVTEADGERFFAVPDDHLTFFEGDSLCESCSEAHGVL